MKEIELRSTSTVKHKTSDSKATACGLPIPKDAPQGVHMTSRPCAKCAAAIEAARPAEDRLREAIAFIRRAIDERDCPERFMKCKESGCFGGGWECSFHSLTRMFIEDEAADAFEARLVAAENVVSKLIEHEAGKTASYADVQDALATYREENRRLILLKRKPVAKRVD